jgi:hypothetical protein
MRSRRKASYADGGLFPPLASKSWQGFPEAAVPAPSTDLQI